MDGPFPKLCLAVTLSHQDGCHSAVALLLKVVLIQVSDYRLLGASGYRKQSEFKTIFFKNNEKIPRCNSKRKLQDKVKRKMTMTKLQSDLNFPFDQRESILSHLHKATSSPSSVSPDVYPWTVVSVS